tara:strand:- start:48 stop:317 length:270 start_codon:yes stop_codon:yes gene_type:complete
MFHRRRRIGNALTDRLLESEEVPNLEHKQEEKLTKHLKEFEKIFPDENKDYLTKVLLKHDNDLQKAVEEVLENQRNEVIKRDYEFAKTL